MSKLLSFEIGVQVLKWFTLFLKFHISLLLIKLVNVNRSFFPL